MIRYAMMEGHVFLLNEDGLFKLTSTDITDANKMVCDTRLLNGDLKNHLCLMPYGDVKDTGVEKIVNVEYVDDKDQLIDIELFLKLADKIGFPKDRLDIKQLYKGTIVELEHGKESPSTNITDDDLEMTMKIAWRHMEEFPDYYIRLEKMEEEGKAAYGKEQ